MARPSLSSFPLAGASALCLSLAGFGAWAQSGEPVTLEEALQICAGVRKERDRLDCFEGLAAAAREDGAAGETAEGPQPSDAGGEGSAADGEIMAAPVREEPGADGEAGGGDAGRPASGEDPENLAGEAGGEAPGAESGAPPEGAPEAPPAVAGDPEPSTRKRFVILPAEEAEERLSEPKTPGQKRERYRARIRKAWRNGENRLFLLLETGEVYKQTSSKKATTPKPGDEIELRPATFGGWFVELRDGYRATRMSLINK